VNKKNLLASITLFGEIYKNNKDNNIPNILANYIYKGVKKYRNRELKRYFYKQKFHKITIKNYQ